MCEGDPLLPVVDTVLERLCDWVMDTRDRVDSFVSERVREMEALSLSDCCDVNDARDVLSVGVNVALPESDAVNVTVDVPVGVVVKVMEREVELGGLLERERVLRLDDTDCEYEAESVPLPERVAVGIEEGVTLSVRLFRWAESDLETDGVSLDRDLELVDVGVKRRAEVVRCMEILRDCETNDVSVIVPDGDLERVGVLADTDGNADMERVGVTLFSRENEFTLGLPVRDKDQVREIVIDEEPEPDRVRIQDNVRLVEDDQLVDFTRVSEWLNEVDLDCDRMIAETD